MWLRPAIEWSGAACLKNGEAVSMTSEIKTAATSKDEVLHDSQLIPSLAASSPTKWVPAIMKRKI